MSVLNKIIEDYEAANVDNYFKPKSRIKDHPFRILDQESMLHGYKVFSEEEDENGKPVKVVRRFLPENGKMAMSWGTRENPARTFLAMKIWSPEAKDCYIYEVTQTGILKAIFDVAKQVGTENLEKVTFFLNKQGEGKETKYVLSTAKDSETCDILLTPTPKEALEALALRPINMLALMFGDRPWDNDTEYDLSDLVQRAKPCPAALAKAMDSLPSTVRSKKGVARV